MTQTPDAGALPPTIELAAAEHLSGLTVAIARDGEPMTIETYGVVRVGTDLQDLVAEHGAVIKVRRIGGVRVTWQATARLAVDVHALSYADAWAVQDVVDAHLADRYRPTRARLRLDSWTNESAAAEQPYPNGDLTVIASIWRVSTRQLLA